MTDAVLTAALPRDDAGTRALAVTGRAWFFLAVAGQWLFAAYMAAFFGGAALDGDFARWNDELPRAFVAGQPWNNLAVAAHLLLAFVVLVGGPVQFSAALRARFPRLHRWNGRVYLVTSLLTALGGLYVLLTRGTMGDATMHVAMSFNTLLIACFAVLAWRSARERDFEMHRVWVLRLFLAVAGVWFFRVGLMFWLAVNNGPVGFDARTFSGPFLTFLGFAQTLLPLAALQLWLVAERSDSAVLRYGTAAVIGALTVAMSLGLYVAANTMWLPYL